PRPATGLQGRCSPRAARRTKAPVNSRRRRSRGRAMEQLDVAGLGPLEVPVDGKTVDVRGACRRALLLRPGIDAGRVERDVARRGRQPGGCERGTRGGSCGLRAPGRATRPRARRRGLTRHHLWVAIEIVWVAVLPPLPFAVSL